MKLKSAADAASNLDKLMMEIKDEIKDAQKLFEVKSSLVSYIMDNILTLQSMGKIIDSNRYQEQLNKLIEEGEVFELNSLLKSTEKTIEMYK
ncbi:GTP pyrophosphokinase [Clostridium botulinum A1 str. CFSAN002368]|nr:GTP pyrophosphokinase [Clostridium botulinum A1 str. CFSAN002368]